MYPAPSPVQAAACLPELPPTVDRRLRRTAARYSQTPAQADDAYGLMTLAIYERQAKQPAFFSQTPAYITRFGTFQALNELRDQYQETRYAVTVTADRAQELADPCHGIEDRIAQREDAITLLEAIKKLSPQKQRVVKMVYLGKTQAEIAAALGISASAVSQLRKSISVEVRAQVGS